MPTNVKKAIRVIHAHHWQHRRFALVFVCAFRAFCVPISPFANVLLIDWNTYIYMLTSLADGMTGDGSDFITNISNVKISYNAMQCQSVSLISIIDMVDWRQRRWQWSVCAMRIHRGWQCGAHKARSRSRIDRQHDRPPPFCCEQFILFWWIWPKGNEHHSKYCYIEKVESDGEIELANGR